MKKAKTIKRIIAAPVILIVVCLAAFGVYLYDCHAGDADALRGIASPSEGVSVVITDDAIAFVPEGVVKAGIIFYPGMKIRGEAYSLLADPLAGNGYLCVLVNMPLNMSVLNSDAALSVMEAWPETEDWYIGGHSMGGQSAQKCVLDHPGVFQGLITVGRQLDYDFTDNDTPILGIYGSKDAICTPENVTENESRKNADRYTELIIDGGCHGYFGNYGDQRWDGEPTVSREEQLQATVSAILDFVK